MGPLEYVPEIVANLFIASLSIIHTRFVAFKDSQVLTLFVCVEDGQRIEQEDSISEH